MYNTRNQPTMSGQQTGAYDALSVTNLSVSGNVAVSGLSVLSSLGGSCITDSLTTTSSTRAASATAVSTLNSNMTSYLPLAGGNVSGNVIVGGTLYASNVNAIAGYTSTYAYETHSSNLVIENAGTGPALVVTQSQTGPLGAQPVAQFFNGAGTAALVIDNNGNVGVNKATAAAELDVSGAVHATSFVGDGSGLTGLASTWKTNSTNVYIPAGSNVGIGTTNPATGVAVYGTSSASMSMNCEGSYYKNLWVGVMGTDHVDSSNAQIRMSKTTGSIFIDPASGVAGNCIYLNQIAGYTTTQIISFGDWYHNTSGLVVLGSGGTTHVGIGKTDPSSSYALDVNGSVNVSGSIVPSLGFKVPTFKIYQAIPQSISSTTKILLDTVQYDPFGYWNSSTKRWIPLIAGYYMIHGSVMVSTSAGTCLISNLCKNGTQFATGCANGSVGGNYPQSTCASIVYLNGSTDYLELTASNAPTNLTTAGIVYTYMCGALVSSP